MDYVMLLQEYQSFDHLHCIVPNFVGREPDESRGFQMLEHISMKQLKHKAVMLSEVGLVKHPHNVVVVHRILDHDILKILCFFVCKFMVHLCIPCDLYSIDGFLGILMISALHNLGKGPLAQHLHDLVAVGDMLPL